MPRSSNPAIALVNVALIPMGLACLVIGITGLAAMDEIWWAFALLAVTGALLVGGALHGIVGWRRALQSEDRTTRALLAAAGGEPGTFSPAAYDPGARAPGGAQVLAHWRYGPDEWRAWAAAEIRYRTREALGMTGTVLVLGTLLIGVLEGEWTLALMISGVVGGLIGGVRWAMAWSAYRRHHAAPGGEIIIGPTALLVNGRYEALRDRRIDFGGARVLENARPPVLEITVMVPGKYRRVPEEYRIPIPAGRMDDARAVAGALNRAHQALPAAAAAAPLAGG